MPKDSLAVQAVPAGLQRLAKHGVVVPLRGEHADAAQGRYSRYVLTLPHAFGFVEESSVAGSSAVGQQQSLDSHQGAVRDRAEQMATNLGLGEAIVRAIVCAAGWHDEGKRDPRFQLMLHGGDSRRAAAASEPIAKSGMPATDRLAFRLARERAGYPRGMRHEALSAEIVRRRLDRNGSKPLDVDVDLVVHLVASHHGRGRPLLPPVADPVPLTLSVPGASDADVWMSTHVSVDWDAPQRFARLQQTYGRWQLALFESVVRLADIWCSARGEGRQ